MSDNFDKEAEREKLREKFGDDGGDREHTQRMSELLLQGATMTNRHCETCGDPIFRHDGREFCPTCHATDEGFRPPAGGADGEGAAPVEASDGAAAAAGADATGADGAPRRGGAADGQSPPGRSEGADRSRPDRAEGTEQSPPGRSQGIDRPSGAIADATPDGTPGRNAAGDAAEPAGAGTPTTAETEAPAPATGGIGQARESLTRTLVRFTRAAAETDDPRRARDHLRAAREAAETLSALDR